MVPIEDVAGDVDHRRAAYRALYNGDVGFDFRGVTADQIYAQCPACGTQVLTSEDGVLDHRAASPGCR